MMQSAPLNFRRVIILLGRLTLGAIFIYAGYAKLLYPTHILQPFFALKFAVNSNLSHFQEQVESYKVLSSSASGFVAHTLPFVEIFLGLMLLIGWRVKIWATIVMLILIGFLSVVTRAFLLHMDINCGCFATPEKLTGMTVVRDGALTLFAMLITVFAFQEARKPHPWTSKQTSSL
jgi:uncharacterized membrane protein YphA (DoxX/SURF4 family)